MKATFPLYILMLMLLLVSCQPKVSSVTQKESAEFQIEDSVAYGHQFLKGSGLGGTSLTFNIDSTFSQIGFCDICPQQSHTYGYYIEDTSSIILVDTIWYNVDTEGRKSFDFEDKRKKYDRRILEKNFKGGKLVLSESPWHLEKGLIFRKQE